MSEAPLQCTASAHRAKGGSEVGTCNNQGHVRAGKEYCQGLAPNQTGAELEGKHLITCYFKQVFSRNRQ